jgi:hypothetical protein
MFQSINDLTIAERHIRRGAAVALVTALLGLFVVSVAMASEATGFWSFWNDPWGLVEVALTLVLAFGIWRRSRVAAGVIIVHFIACRAYLWTTLKTPGPLGILLACVIFAFYWNALRGTIAYHRLRRAAEAGYRTFRNWHLVIWIPAGALGFIILGLSIFSIFTPSIAVLEGGSLKQADEAFLREQEIVEPDELILLFYSAGVFSIKEDGNLLTDRRVISYETYAGELIVYAAAFDEIEEILIDGKGSTFSDTVIRVVRIDGEEFLLYLTVEDDGDERFIRDLRKAWRAARSPRDGP